MAESVQSVILFRWSAQFETAPVQNSRTKWSPLYSVGLWQLLQSPLGKGTDAPLAYVKPHSQQWVYLDLLLLFSRHRTEKAQVGLLGGGGT